MARKSTVPEVDPYETLNRTSGITAGSAPKTAKVKGTTYTPPRFSMADQNRKDYGGMNQANPDALARMRALGDPSGSDARGAQQAALLNDPTMQAFLAGLNQPQPEGEDPLTALLNSLGAGGSGGGGGGSGYDLNGALGGIAQAYQTRLDEMIRQRDAGDTEIGAAKKAATDTITARQADQAKVSSGINDSILMNYSKAHDSLNTEGAALAAELQKFGVDPSKIAPTITQSQGYLGQAKEAQSALSQRMQQIAADSMASRNSNVDLVAQGATGELANNYAQVKMSMDLQRMQEEAQVRQQAAAAARSGGGGGSDPIDQATKMLKLQGLYQDVTGTGPVNEADFLKQNGQYDTELLDPNSGAYVAAMSGGNPDGTLRNFYTSDQVLGYKDDGVTPITQQVFDEKGYLKAYQDLQAAKQSQLALAKGDTGYRTAYQTSTALKNGLAKLSYSGILGLGKKKK